jgi:hypothetical protein
MNNIPPELVDATERRGTIRESNQKLDQAIEHLSDVLEHLKLGDVQRDVSNQIHSLRTSLILGFTLTWFALVSAAVMFFVHSRDQSQLDTMIQVVALKMANTEKDIMMLKKFHNEHQNQDTAK